MNKKKYCEACDGEYITTRSNAKYCSAACKQFAYRSRLISPMIDNPINSKAGQLQVNELQLQQERIRIGTREIYCENRWKNPPFEILMRCSKNWMKIEFNERLKQQIGI
jgi:hypothetical protein